MSVQTLYTAATGMESLQTKLDTVAHNLANVNTVGFKRMRANFEDNFYRQEVYPGTLDEAGRAAATFQLRKRDFPKLVGRTYYCAFVVFGDMGVEFASDPVAVIVAP